MEYSILAAGLTMGLSAIGAGIGVGVLGQQVYRGCSKTARAYTNAAWSVLPNDGSY